MQQRIALIGMYHESNSFSPKMTRLENFKSSHWLVGNEIIKAYEFAHHEIGGMIEILHQLEMKPVPVIFVEATPGGIIEGESVEILIQCLMNEVAKVLPVDGCLVIAHGAASSEQYADLDGYWLTLLRDKLGPNVPIVGTIDPHANMSELMVNATDALIAYATNPHIDQRETGKKAAHLLARILAGTVRPTQALTQVPMVISIDKQLTQAEPCCSLYNLAVSLCDHIEILSVSVILGFPYADVREMGTSFLVVSNGSHQKAIEVGKILKNYIIENRRMFTPSLTELSSSLNKIAASEKPVLLLDMGDNVGGGSPGNSTVLFELLEQMRSCLFFICIDDPIAVNNLINCIENQSVRISFGEPVQHLTVKVEKIFDGQFSEEAPRHGGQLHFDMGKTAIVRTAAGNVVMLTSLRTAPFSLKQLTSFGLNPLEFDVIVAKGVNAPIAAYGTVCPTSLQVNSPGVTQIDLTSFDYKNRRRPLYPFEEISVC